MQLLAYANVHSPRYEEDDLNLNLLNRNQPSAIEQIDIEAEQELAEIEAEAQRRRAGVENRRITRVARVNLLYENTIFVGSGSHKNMYPTSEDFIALIESDVGIINFIKDPEISGAAVKTAFTVIIVASYAYILPRMKEKGIQLIAEYLRQVPVVGSALNTSLNAGLSIISLPYDFVKWAWNPKKYEQQRYAIGDEYSPSIPIFNEDGTPQMYETSQQEKTKYIGKVVGIIIALKYGPFLARKLIDKINELRATHLLNQDWARTFFSSYFTWKVKKLRDIEARYSMPDVFHDPFLNQPKYRCARSGQFLIIPFKTPSNTVFQYSVIEDWLLSHHTCPVTEENLQADQLSFDATTYDEIRYRLQAINR